MIRRNSGDARAFLCSCAIVIAACAHDDSESAVTDTDVLGAYVGTFADNADTLKPETVYSFSDDARLGVDLFEGASSQRARICLAGWVKLSVGKAEDDCETLDIEIVDGVFTLHYKVDFKAVLVAEDELEISSFLVGRMTLRRDDGASDLDPELFASD